MKRKDVVDYVAKCVTCLQVKAEHQKSVGTFQSKYPQVEVG